MGQKNWLMCKGVLCQGAKNIIFTACHSGKLKLALILLAQTSFQLAPIAFWQAELISQFSCYSNTSKNITCPSGKLKRAFTGPIDKSTAPSYRTVLSLHAVCRGRTRQFSFYREMLSPYSYDRLGRYTVIEECSEAVDWIQLTTPENTITYHNALCLSPKNFA